MTEVPEANGVKITPQEAAYNQFIGGASMVLINGLRASLPEVPIVPLMVKMCGALGAGIGQLLSVGLFGEVMQARTACVEAFTKNLRQVKIQAPPLVSPPAQKLNS